MKAEKQEKKEINRNLIIGAFFLAFLVMVLFYNNFLITGEVTYRLTGECTDSDGGKNYYVAGNVTYYNKETEGYETLFDYCSSDVYANDMRFSVKVVEQSCTKKGKLARPTNRRCRRGEMCEEGICVPITSCSKVEGSVYISNPLVNQIYVNKDRCDFSSGGNPLAVVYYCGLKNMPTRSVNSCVSKYEICRLDSSNNSHCEVDCIESQTVSGWKYARKISTDMTKYDNCSTTFSGQKIIKAFCQDSIPEYKDLQNCNDFESCIMEQVPGFPEFYEPECRTTCRTDIDGLGRHYAVNIYDPNDILYDKCMNNPSLGQSPDVDVAGCKNGRPAYVKRENKCPDFSPRTECVPEINNQGYTCSEFPS